MTGDKKVWVEAELTGHSTQGGTPEVALTLVDVAERRKLVKQYGRHVAKASMRVLEAVFPSHYFKELKQGYPVRFKMFSRGFVGLLMGGPDTGRGELEGLEGRQPSMRSAGEGWAKKHASIKDTFTLDQLAQEFGLPTMESLDESNLDYYAEAGHYAYEYALKEGLTEAEAEKAREEAEQEAQTEVFHKWHGGVTQAVESLFGEHGLELVPRTRGDYPFEYKLKPVKSWEDVADKIRETINGVGMFHFNSLREFLESGPYTARAAALSHLHWIKSWPEVYGAYSARHIFDRAWR